MKKLKTYWEEHGKSGLYQMGDNPVRSYLAQIMVNHSVESLLDIGCGSGSMYQVLKEKKLLPYYTGTDYSSSFIDVCRKEFPDDIWIEDDMRKLWNFNENEFDMLLYLHSFDHIDKWMDALDQALRVSKKYVLICLWRPFSQGAINTSHHADFEDSHLSEYNQEELESYMKNIGFKIELSEEKYHGKQYNYIYLLSKET